MKRIAILCLLALAVHASAQPWSIEKLGTGAKPEIALDDQGRPHIAYMIEDLDGGTFYTVRNADGWQTDQVAGGYFYGPLDIALDGNGIPHIIYHDHEATGGIDDGDLAYAVLQGGNWATEIIADRGHDGWDGTLALDAQGRPHTAAIDPSQFGSTSGLEWAVKIDGDWTVTAIGSGPLPYEFGTDIAIDTQDRPHIVYHDGDERLNNSVGADLLYATLDSGDWIIGAIDTEGDVGKFPSLILDSQDRPHIAYFKWDSRNGGELKYAAWDGTAWQIESVDRMEDINIAFIGARRSMSLALDAQDRPHIAYSDRTSVRYTRKNGDSWETGQIVALPSSVDLELGQLVSLALEANGRPHLTFFELPLNASKSTGTVYYAVGAIPTPTAISASASADQPLPTSFTLEQNYPNPFNPTTTIHYALPQAGTVQLDIYDTAGQHIRGLVDAHQAAGTFQVIWDGTDTAGRAVASGIYMSRLRTNHFAQMRKMVLLR